MLYLPTYCSTSATVKSDGGTTKPSPSDSSTNNGVLNPLSLNQSIVTSLPCGFRMTPSALQIERKQVHTCSMYYY